MADSAVNIQTCLILAGEWFFFYFPAALMAVWPVKKYLRVPSRKLLPPCFCALSVLCAFFSGVEYSQKCAEEAGRSLTFLQKLSPWFDLMLLAGLFTLYFSVVKLSPVKSIYVLTSDAAVLSFGGILNYVVTAVLIPSASALETSAVEGLLIQGLFYLLYLIFFFGFWNRRMAWILETDLNRRTWTVAFLTPAIVCFCNNMMVPQYPAILTEGRMTEVSLVVIGSEFALFMVFQGLFYTVVSTLVAKYRAENTSAVLRIQAEQYRQLKTHLDTTRRLRHDFRHMLFALQQMAEDGDMEEIKACLTDYLGETGPDYAAQVYCQNSAVNALMAHFSQKAKEAGAQLQLQLDLPAQLPYSDTDLCIVFGNILEDALEAVQKTAKEERRIRLMTDRDEPGRLYIVMVNGCSGETVFEDGLPRTTRARGGGIGLSSVRLIAEKYGGIAEFRREGNLFYTNIMLPVPDSGR